MNDNPEKLEEEIIEMPDFGFPIPEYVERHIRQLIEIYNREGQDGTNYWICSNKIDSYLKNCYIAGDVTHPYPRIGACKSSG